MTVTDLPGAWRQRAADLRAWADAQGAAQALEHAADQLEAAIAAAADEELTLAEAAEVSGYSKRRLRELISDGALPNAGRKGAPRIRRNDLPRKPRSSPAGRAYDVEADAAYLAEKLP